MKQGDPTFAGLAARLRAGTVTPADLDAAADAIEASAKAQKSEREACAAICEQERDRRRALQIEAGFSSGRGMMHGQVSEAMRETAVKIRARSDQT